MPKLDLVLSIVTLPPHPQHRKHNTNARKEASHLQILLGETRLIVFMGIFGLDIGVQVSQDQGSLTLWGPNDKASRYSGAQRSSKTLRKFLCQQPSLLLLFLRRGIVTWILAKARS